MLKSYLKLALRNIWKRKATTAINVLSLSVGLASCALVFLFCQHELSYDKGFDHGEDVYRVTSIFKDGQAPTVAFPFATWLKSEIPQIEHVSRLDATNGSSIVQVAGNGTATPYTIKSGYWVDPEFFNILSFHFLHGNRATAFSGPNTVVVSQSLAKKLFGDTYPIGRPLKINSNRYTISGVFKADFLNHLQADFFALNDAKSVQQRSAAAINWAVDPNYYTYIKLKRGSNVAQVIKELNAYTQRHSGTAMKAANDNVTVSLQPLSAIHLHSVVYQDYLQYKQGNIQYLYLLGCIALVILALGCVNYVNLATAQAISRAGEIGVRRVMGATKSAIRYQFLLETLAVSLLAMVVAIFFALLFLPEFNQLTGQSLSFFARENRTLILWFLVITLVTGLVAGLYPAFYLSGFKPVKVLKGKISDAQGMFSIRKLLIVFQFAISTCLVFATIVIWNQLDFMTSTKPGFDQDQQLVLNLHGDQAKSNSVSFINELKNNSIFKAVSGACAPLVSSDMMFYAPGKTVADKQDINLNLTDSNYINTLGLHLVSGNNFEPAAFRNKSSLTDIEINDISRQIILNEKAIKVLGLNAYTAPGKYISRLHNGVVYQYKIIGVVSDYHYYSLHSEIGPFGVLPVNPGRFITIVAKINGRNVSKALQYAQQKWKEINPDTPFNYDFLNNIFRNDYQRDQNEQQLSSIFTVIAIAISCLGLFGLITYSVTQKAREIGIRKVIGASVKNVVLLFTGQYVKLIVVANVIAAPVSWYLMHNWLQDFPYRIHISWWMFIVALIVGVITCFATITFKTVKAARANPVDSLRTE